MDVRFVWDLYTHVIGYMDWEVDVHEDVYVDVDEDVDVDVDVITKLKMRKIITKANNENNYSTTPIGAMTLVAPHLLGL